MVEVSPFSRDFERNRQAERLRIRAARRLDGIRSASIPSPEAFGGRVHNVKTGTADYPIQRRLLTPRCSTAYSSATGPSTGAGAAAVGTALPTANIVPHRRPHASLVHRGHAISAGACVTILKAWLTKTRLSRTR